MEDATLINVAINQLVPSKRNVRKSKSTKEADQELLAGIRAEGLLQNLVVIPNGKPDVFEVVAGKRRLKALQQLVKEGYYQEGHTVPCRYYADAANAEEISLIENTQRLRMHPADEFEACRKMQRKGKGSEEIAASLGIPETTVKKRLKLGQVAPEIMRAYRGEEIDLDDVMAFTIEDDKAKQVEVFKSLTAEGALSPFRIRAALRGETETSRGRLAKFVGEKAYTKAGGRLSEDLFQEVQYYIDRDILVDLAIAKLDRAAKKIEGWNWTEITIDAPQQLSMKRIEKYDSPETAKFRERAADIEEKCRQLEELGDEMDDKEWEAQHLEQFHRLEDKLVALDTEIESSQHFKPEEMALAGCIITIGNNGKVSVIDGLVRKSDEKALRALQAPPTQRSDSDTGGEQDASGPGNSHQPQPQPEDDTISQALHDDLVTYRLNIAKRFIAIGGENEARDLLYYTLCMQTFNTHYWASPLDIQIRETRPATSLKKPDTGRALQELQEHHDTGLNLAWISTEDPAERFTKFCELSLNEKNNLMAYCVAQALTCGLADRPVPETETALRSLDIPWHKYFQATADNYLGRISKERLLGIGERFFTDYRAEGAEKRSRKQLAADLEGVLAGEDDTMPADKRAEAIDWIPEGFRPQ